MKKKLYICTSGVVVIIVIYVITSMKSDFVTNNVSDIKSSSHHTKKGFCNPWPGFEKQGFSDFLKWVLIERRNSNKYQNAAGYDFETVENDGSFLRENRHEFTVTWVGHSTLFIQLQGLNIVTDPMWSDRASPVTWAGPKRFVKPGISLNCLPAIDLVLITHNHYDHLDTRTIQRLGSEPLYFVPLGLGAFLEKYGISQYCELDWWDSVRYDDMEIVCAPAQHFSSRGMFDRNKTLWCSWIVRSRSGSFFFCGDSGYFPDFKEIGKRYGPFDLACLPIGAYLPKWFMGSVHLSPKEAIQAFRDVRGRRFLAVHWGTFSLAADPLGLAPNVLLNEIREQNLKREDFWLLKHGETRIVPQNVSSTVVE